MALTLISNNGKINYNIKEYIADSLSDLPVDGYAGSTAYVISAKKNYILNSLGQWKESALGASGGGFEPVVLTSSQVDPTTGKPTILNPNPKAIYFAPNADGTSTEWMYISSDWERIGSSDVDLTAYAQKTYVDTEVAKKQNTLVSGTNIKTINNTSLLGEGNIAIDSTSLSDNTNGGINITVGSTTKVAAAQSELENVAIIEVNENYTTSKLVEESDLTSYQKKLVAGDNITIDETTNTISASGGGSDTGFPFLTDGQWHWVVVQMNQSDYGYNLTTVSSSEGAPGLWARTGAASEWGFRCSVKPKFVYVEWLSDYEGAENTFTLKTTSVTTNCTNIAPIQKKYVGYLNPPNYYLIGEPTSLSDGEQVKVWIYA